MGKIITTMAKIPYCIFGILLFFISCTNRVSTPGLETKKDSAIADIPVLVDTTYADTATVQVIDTVIVDIVTETPVKDTVAVIIVTEKAYPELTTVYRKYIGVREKTGNNDGPEVEMFLKSVGLGKGYPWCAAYVKYCMLEAGIKSAEVMNGMALSTVNKKNMVYSAGKKIKDPLPGDVFTLYYPSLKRIGHTGFFDKSVNSTVFETVEGNTNAQNSREGDGVYRRKRSYNATYNISRWK